MEESRVSLHGRYRSSHQDAQYPRIQQRLSQGFKRQSADCGGRRRTWNARLHVGRSRTSLRLGSPRQSQRERSEEHTSELQSQSNLVCRLLLEKKKKKKQQMHALLM